MKPGLSSPERGYVLRQDPVALASQLARVQAQLDAERQVNAVLRACVEAMIP